MTKRAIAIFFLCAFSAVAGEVIIDVATGTVTERELTANQVASRQAESDRIRVADALEITQPLVLSRPIEVPVIVLTDLTQTNVAYGYYSANGELIGGILDHASPRDPAAIQQRIASNRLQRAAEAATLASIKTNAATANSIPALREQVRRLVELLESK